MASSHPSRSSSSSMGGRRTATTELLDSSSSQLFRVTRQHRRRVIPSPTLSERVPPFPRMLLRHRRVTSLEATAQIPICHSQGQSRAQVRPSSLPLTVSEWSLQASVLLRALRSLPTPTRVGALPIPSSHRRTLPMANPSSPSSPSSRRTAANSSSRSSHSNSPMVSNSRISNSSSSGPSNSKHKRLARLLGRPHNSTADGSSNSSNSSSRLPRNRNNSTSNQGRTANSCRTALRD
mmetsp:Transcript_5640/g.21816  ORF Transcript_5640/g.21816 Transcript_5640/m.21816 type:complete len:236 (+) Transcript_5640:98-805(+)